VALDGSQRTGIHDEMSFLGILNGGLTPIAGQIS
jgi:hypothetical protein